MNPPKILIAGVGQIGSRHLQGVARSGLSTRVDLFDPRTESLETATNRLKEVPEAAQVAELRSFTRLDDLDREYDLAILACNADIRWELLQNLFRAREIPRLLLEKVVFQRTADFEAALRWVEEKKARAWVNCPMRTLPAFTTIRSELPANEPIHIHVGGGPIGMGCNAVHYIDLGAFLSGSPPVSFDADGLAPEPFPAKRPGFFETEGTAWVTFRNGSTLTLSLFNREQPYEIEIRSGTSFWRVSPFEKTVVKRSAPKDASPETRSFPFPFQSEMTGTIVARIFADQEVGLPTLRESFAVHSEFLKEMTEYFSNRLGKEFDRCPVT